MDAIIIRFGGLDCTAELVIMLILSTLACVGMVTAAENYRLE